MKEICLTNGGVAIVDNEDFEWLSRWKWHKSSVPGRFNFYAKRSKRIGGRVVSVYMHRELALVLGIPIVDHHDGDGLNNRRSNLRPSTAAQNSENSRKHTAASSRFKGVYWHTSTGKWRATIRPGSYQKHLGYFVDEVAAARAYDAAALVQFGEFACLNFSDKIRG